MSGPRDRAEEPVAQSAPPVIERVPAPARSEPALVAAGNSAVARGFTAPRSVAVGVHVARMANAGNGAVSRALSGPAPGTAPGGFAERLGSAESGEPIPDGVRGDLESSFGTSLGEVRLHQGSRAGGLADEVNAKAFTVGKDIYFGSGRFDPSSAAGYHLLAHEVTHTQQQSGGGSVAASSISVSDPGDASERDAERVAERLTAGRSAGPVSGAQPHVARAATDVIPDFILNGVKSAVTAVPGYVLLTYIIGKDPITDRPVTASPVELVEKLLTYGPFGASVGQVLQAMDVLRDIYSMVTSGLAEHNLTVARIGHEISTAWDEISITGGIDGNIAVVRRHIDAILTDVAAFVRVMVNRVLEAVRKAAAEVAEPHLETPQIKPVWELAKKVFHYDPLRGTEVNAPTVEILGDFLHLIGKDEALAQMRERGTLQQAADWLDTQFATFIGIKNDVFALFRDAWNAISPENLPNLLNTLPQLAQRAWALIQRIAAFAATVVGKVLELIKNALLGYLSAHASEIPGFRLLTVMIEQNPFTGQAVPRTAENLIGGFIALLPNGEATYQKLAESGVIGQAAGRITSAMTRLGITVELITSTFRGIWDSLSLEDLAAPLAAFERVMAKFRDPINRIVEFVTEVVKVVIELILKLMNFPSDLLGSIIDNATRAIDDIEKDPVAFLMNMLEALKRGFLGFFDGIVGFLVEGLGAWLFRGLGAMGITRPPDLSLKSILDLTLQVLGISVDMLWQRLALQIGPERVAQMRGAVDTLTGAWAFLKEVQQDGVAAIWRHVESMLGNLWETILNLAKNWIMTEIVDRVIAKIISMLDPTGIMAIVNSFIAFIKAIQSAIDYIRDILEIVNQYVTTFAQVAAGNIVPGAEKVTRGLANAVPIAIGFLANQVGLGNVPEKVVEIIGGLREMINEAIDWLIKQALSLGQSIMSGLGLGGEQEGQQGAQPSGPLTPFDVVFAETSAAVDAKLQGGGVDVNQALHQVESEMSGMGLKSLRLEPDEQGGGKIVASINPELTIGQLTQGRDTAQMTCWVKVIFRAGAEHGAVEPGWNTVTAPDPAGVPTDYDFNYLQPGSGKVPRERGGAVFRQADSGNPNETEMMTWNTAAGMSKSSNDDHAERFLVVWLDSLKDRWADIESVSVTNNPYSPCTECGSQLQAKMVEINNARAAVNPARGKVAATLAWRQQWDKGANATKVGTIPSMTAWVVTPANIAAPTGQTDDDLKLATAKEVAELRAKLDRNGELARLKGMSIETVRQMIARGEIKV